MLGDGRRTIRGCSGGWRAGTAPGCTHLGEKSHRRRRGYGTHLCGFGGTARGRKRCFRRDPGKQPLVMGRSMAKSLLLFFCRKTWVVQNTPAALGTAGGLHRIPPVSGSISGTGAPSLNADLRRASERASGSRAVPSMGQGAAEIHQVQLLWQHRRLPVPA